MVYVIGAIVFIFLLVKYWWLALIAALGFVFLLAWASDINNQKSKPEKPAKPSVSLLSSVDGMDGHDFEHWCADLLRQNGFTNVSVTPGSNDQGIDVLAYKDGLRYGIQCKCYSHDLGNTPVQEATAGRAVYGCDIAVVMTNQRFTKGAVEAAKATGVWLWDRDKLAQMVQTAKQESNT